MSFPPITHVAVTVRDLDVSVPWYEQLFETAPVLDEDTGPFRHVVWMLGGTLFGLHHFADTDTAAPFTERRAGLDHVAFTCVDRAELECWEKRLDQLGARTAASWTPATARGCRSVTPTACRWSSSPRRLDPRGLTCRAPSGAFGESGDSPNGPSRPTLTRSGCGRDPSGTRPRVPVMAVARFPVVVLDCPDPQALAEFYGALLDWEVEPGEDFWFIRAGYGDGIGFQKVDGFTPPRWPGQDQPQQMHLDVTVEDLDVGEAAVLAIGATKHDHQPGTTFRVFLDPAGHPFCLCLS